MRSPSLRHQSGVSLIEAAVALAVMSIGVTALVGVQSTLRYNNDISRQRSDAARIAAQELEAMRFFQSLGTVNGQANPSWDDLADATTANYTLPGAANSANYTVQRTVVDSGTLNNGARSKTAQVTVSWTDRTGVNNQVRLGTIIARTNPVASALLSANPSFPAFSLRSGRALTIPAAAVTQSGADAGTSRFEPPGLGGAAWYFNNLTGYITKVCDAAGVCTGGLSGRLVSGTVRYAQDVATPDFNVAASPTGTLLPLSSSQPITWESNSGPFRTINVSSLDCGTEVSPDVAEALNYYCLVQMPTPADGWIGKLNINPAGWTIGSAAGTYKVCRYTRYVAVPVGALHPEMVHFVSNGEHPRTYGRVDLTNLNLVNATVTTVNVTENLTNQNFLVIQGTSTCPTDSRDIDAAAGGALVNYHTAQHQPTPSP